MRVRRRRDDNDDDDDDEEEEEEEEGEEEEEEEDSFCQSQISIHVATLTVDVQLNCSNCIQVITAGEKQLILCLVLLSS